LLPEKMAEVDPRTRAPLWAMLAMVIPGLIVSALYVYNVTIGDVGFQSLTLTSTMVIAVTYLGTTIGAILLPYIKKDLYEASPIAKYKVAGIPLLTVAGILFGLFLAYLLFQWLLDPNALYGIGFSINPDGLQNPWSFVFIGGMYVLAIVLYFGFKTYRKRQGIDVDNVYKEIPVE